MIEPTVTTRILPGKPLREVLLAQVAKVTARLAEDKVVPTLCVLQAGENAASDVYVRQKRLACERAGIAFRLERLEVGASEDELHAAIARLAVAADVHGILVQTPLPRGWNVPAALDAVPAAKDVDGIGRESIALRRKGDAAALLPATPLGIFRLLDWAGLSLEGKRIGIAGQGLVVGAPLTEMLRQRGLDVCSVVKETPEPEKILRACDVVVSATGVANLITAAWLKPGALVIDAGTTELTQSETMGGDVDRDSVEGIAGMLTPVPGGVGPVTVASLLTNIVDAACLQLGRPRTAWMIDVAPEA